MADIIGFSLLAFVLCAALLFTGRILALRLGFADAPGGRKMHDVPVPPIGGLAILPVFALVSYLDGAQDIVPLPLVIGLGILLLMGAIDDIRPIKPSLKFAIMVLTCCYVVIFGEGQIHSLGNLFGLGDVSLGLMANAFTVMAIVLLMNAINMIDGVDGLAGGFCALVTLWFMTAAYAAGLIIPFEALAILLSVLVAFLAFNMRHPLRKKASVFLGDSGALCLGLLIGWFCIKLSQIPDAPLAPATIIWLIALPVMDAFGLFIARSLEGKNPFMADRRHLHHRITDSGVSPGTTTIIMLGLYSIMAMIGLGAQAAQVPAAVLFWLWMAVFIAHTYGILRPSLWASVRQFLLPLCRTTSA